MGGFPDFDGLVGIGATASKGRIGVLVAVGAAVLAGGGVAWMNWLLNLGEPL